MWKVSSGHLLRRSCSKSVAFAMGSSDGCRGDPTAYLGPTYRVLIMIIDYLVDGDCAHASTGLRVVVNWKRILARVHAA